MSILPIRKSLALSLSLCFFLSLSSQGATALEKEAEMQKLLNQANQVFSGGNIDEALALIEEAIKIAPKNPKGHFGKGIVYRATREHEKAEQAFSKVVEVEPKATDAWALRGQERFKIGKVKASIQDFDKEIALDPKREPHHWQRGIAYYYTGQFSEGRNQFELHQTVNPNDVENAVFHFVCLAQIEGFEAARNALIEIGNDPRIPMAEIYRLYKGKGDEERNVERIFEAVTRGQPEVAERNNRFFYAHLYIGLYFEAKGDEKKAEEHIRKAALEYPQKHYMGDVGRVHLYRIQGRLK